MVERSHGWEEAERRISGQVSSYGGMIAFVFWFLLCVAAFERAFFLFVEGMDDVDAWNGRFLF